jgi:hypothetical protein
MGKTSGYRVVFCRFFASPAGPEYGFRVKAVVEDAIRNNKGFPGYMTDRFVHDSQVNGIRAVVTGKGKVITVTPITRVKN